MAWYLNELLLRLLPLEDPHPALFEHYHLTLLALAKAHPLEPLLRAFEWQLLAALGYDFALNCEGSGTSLQPNAYYAWRPETGLYAAAVTEPTADASGVDGAFRRAACTQPRVIFSL